MQFCYLRNIYLLNHLCQLHLGMATFDLCGSCTWHTSKKMKKVNRYQQQAFVCQISYYTNELRNSALIFTPPVSPFTNMNAWISNNVVILSLLKVPYESDRNETRRWNKRSSGRYTANSKRDVLKRKRTNLQT
jgi:hypothetical protein